MSDELVDGYILSNGQLITADKLQKAEEPSKQLPEDPFSNQYDETNLMEPPYNLDQLAQLLEMNTTHMRCCKQKATDAAGLGFTLSSEGEQENEEEKARIEAFLKGISDRPLRALLDAIIGDYEALGFCALEVLRDDFGMVSKVYYVPARTIRVHRDKDRYCQKRDIRKAWFRKYGEEFYLNKDTGTKSDLPNGEFEASEMIYVPKHHSRSDYYGLPDVLPALGSLVGSVAQRDYNIQFFDNNAVPQYAIIIQGATINDQVKELIEHYFRTEVKGQAHKTLVLGIPGQDASVKFEKLAVDMKDASFRLYRQDNIDEILEAHAMPPYRVGIARQGSLGGSTASASDAIYKSAVIEPLQETFESLINEQLIEEGLGITGWTFKFNDLDVEDRDAAATRDIEFLKAGAMTPNQVRERHNLGDPYPGGDRYYIQLPGTPVPAVVGEEGGASEPGVQQRDAVPLDPYRERQQRRVGRGFKSLGDGQ